jgi:hypothetical protein
MTGEPRQWRTRNMRGGPWYSVRRFCLVSAWLDYPAVVRFSGGAIRSFRRH